MSRVNERQQKTLSYPVFMQSAREHEKAIQDMKTTINIEVKKKSLADIYKNNNSDST